MWWGGGPCDFSVSPSPFGLDFGTLDFGLGLDNISCGGNIFEVHFKTDKLVLFDV